MKSKRQNEILTIISEIDVETQDQLLLELKKRGLSATQATISRDIRELHLVKELSSSGMYKYAVSERKASNRVADRLRSIFKNGVLSFEAAQNIVIIKTMPGLASGAAATIDGMNITGVVGSLAGDDTVALFMRNNADANQLCNEIEEMLK
jgi:Arginine repressor